MEVNMLWDVVCSFGAKKARFEGEEKLVAKRRKLVEKSRKLVGKSRASWKINTIITFWRQFMTQEKCASERKRDTSREKDIYL